MAQDLLHLYGNLATVMITSNKLVAEPRQACMRPFKAHTCLSMLCDYNVHVQAPGGVGQASRVSIIAESGQGSPVETRTFFH